MSNYICPECESKHVGQLVLVKAQHDLVSGTVTLENELNDFSIAFGFENFRCLDCTNEFCIDGSSY